MLQAIILRESALRDAMVSHISWVKRTHHAENIVFYQKNQYIFVFSESLPVREIFEKTLQEYEPEKIYFAGSGFSVDLQHEVGDIILPNVFFRFNDEILDVEVTKENADILCQKPTFLEIFDEQKDYYVEDFGLSVGGILVSKVPKNPDFFHAMMSVYEGDIYSENDYTEIANIVSENIIPTFCIMGIVLGKNPKNHQENPFKIISENIMTTIRLMSDED